jgi:hypothetical protein
MKHTHTQILNKIFHPILLLLYVLRKLPLPWFFQLRMYLDGIDRPNYSYGLYQAALEAKALGIPRISAYEFGVAGGTGLVILEKLSKQITRLTGIAIDVYGFDLADGLPSPSDFRDIPYIWQKGFYKMDVEALKQKIQKTTTLVLGDVAKTIPEIINTNISPIGFIAFDLDFYSSTKYTFRLFDVDDKKMLPRVFCYFDDIIGSDEEMHCEYTGELLAIKEFNEEHKTKKIAKIHGMFHKRVIKSAWSDMMYVMHNFHHELYNSYTYRKQDRQNKLS